MRVHRKLFDMRSLLPFVMALSLPLLQAHAEESAPTKATPSMTTQSKTRTPSGPAFSWLQFRVTPSLYFQNVGGSITGTLAWAPSYRLSSRFLLRAQADITPVNTVEGITVLPGGSLGAMYRFTSAWATEVDAGTQMWPGAAWPFVRALAIYSPKGFGLGNRIPIRFHAGYQPMFGVVFTHGLLLGAEISFL